MNSDPCCLEASHRSRIEVNYYSQNTFNNPSDLERSELAPTDCVMFAIMIIDGHW